MAKAVSKRIEALIHNDQFKEARALLYRELKKQPHDHWYLIRLSTTLYEERKYSAALKFAQKAHKLVPTCPLVLWDLAGALDQLGKTDEAMVLWKKLLKRGVRRIAFGPCGEGIKWARSLLADCRYRIGKTYKNWGNVQMARIYYRLYLKDRASGVGSIYNKQVVKKEFQIL